MRRLEPVARPQEEETLWQAMIAVTREVLDTIKFVVQPLDPCPAEPCDQWANAEICTYFRKWTVGEVGLCTPCFQAWCKDMEKEIGEIARQMVLRGSEGCKCHSDPDKAAAVPPGPSGEPSGEGQQLVNRWEPKYSPLRGEMMKGAKDGVR